MSGIAAGLAGATAAGAAGAAAASAALGAAVAPAFAPSRSAFTMRPLGPEPVSVARSMLFSAAIRRASGLAFTRSPLSAFGAGAAGVGAGAALAASGAGAATGAAATGAAFGAGAASALSPSAISVAMTVPTFTLSVPSATRIFPITPSSTASNSIVALSVSISAIRSPDLTVSPSFTSHFASVPSSIVGERAGILISTGINASSSNRIRSARLSRPMRERSRPLLVRRIGSPHLSATIASGGGRQCAFIWW